MPHIQEDFHFITVCIFFFIINISLRLVAFSFFISFDLLLLSTYIHSYTHMCMYVCLLPYKTLCAVITQTIITAATTITTPPKRAHR